MKEILYNYDRTLRRYASFYQIKLGILDNSGNIICFTGSAEENIYFAQYKEGINHVLPVSSSVSSKEGLWLTSRILSIDSSDYYYLVVTGRNQESILTQCISISIALEEMISSFPAEPLKLMENYRSNQQKQLALLLLQKNTPKETVLKLMHQLELDETLLRSIICIRLGFSTNKYFNINLNLGYQPILEKIRDAAYQMIQSCRYFNTQDICSFIGENEIIIFKSFVEGSNLSRVYLALDRICEELESNLNSINLLDVKMACGNVYKDVSQLYQSYSEAKEIISMGEEIFPEKHFYNIESILMENICYFLHPQIIHKILLPKLKLLMDENGVMQDTLLTCAEIFVDHGMNITRASQSAQIHRNTLNHRLERFSAITYLKPQSNFKDALITKLMAIYWKQNPGVFDENAKQFTENKESKERTNG